jgi:hypothetical protein
VEWLNSNVLVAIVSSILTGGLAMLGAFIQLRRLGVDTSNVAEVTDRAQFRADMFVQIKHLTERLDECEEDRAHLHKENIRLERRVITLEQTVNGKH